MVGSILLVVILLAVVLLVVSLGSGSSLGAAPTHKVTFNETGGCQGNADYADKYSITLGGVTKAQPPNAGLPISGVIAFSPAYKNMSQLTFRVPDGNYNYTISPSVEPYPYSGMVRVNGLDVIVQWQVQTPSCLSIPSP